MKLTPRLEFALLLIVFGLAVLLWLVVLQALLYFLFKVYMALVLGYTW